MGGGGESAVGCRRSFLKPMPANESSADHAGGRKSPDSDSDRARVRGVLRRTVTKELLERSLVFGIRTAGAQAVVTPLAHEALIYQSSSVGFEGDAFPEIFREAQSVRESIQLRGCLHRCPRGLEAEAYAKLGSVTFSALHSSRASGLRPALLVSARPAEIECDLLPPAPPTSV